MFDRKIVAWTGLRVPNTSTPPNVSPFGSPDLPKGINRDLWEKMSQGPAQATLSFGYDPAKDFHRRGSHTHGDHQRQGHMRRLTEYCNAIADAAGAKTYSTCKEAAVPLFLSEGYELLGTKTLDMGKWDRVFGRDATHYALMRKPQSMYISKE
jgi:hypothetical protein